MKLRTLLTAASLFVAPVAGYAGYNFLPVIESAITASTFTMSGASAPAGNYVTFTVNRTAGIAPVFLQFVTHDGTAMGGMDYTRTIKTLYFARNQKTALVRVKTSVNTMSTVDLTFTATIQYNSRIVAAGTATVVKGTVITPPSPPATQLCSNGTTIPATDVCPPDPVNPYIVSPTLNGLPDNASNFDFNEALTNIGTLPGTAAPDVVGAFRFICEFDTALYDDPLVYPNQPGRSHLHNFYGNENVNAGSTYATLRSTGGSSCNHYGDGTKAANRSGYWIPAMLDGAGHYVQPDYAAIYYKRRPKTDPLCGSAPSLVTGVQGYCTNLPNGLRFIFGYNMITAGAPSTGSLYFNCQGTGSIPGHYNTIEDVANANACPAGAQLGFIIIAPGCWDGAYLDTPDHRAHVAYAISSAGKLACPLTHPYVIPTFTLGTWYTVGAGDNLHNWKFSSDVMHPELAHGLTGHADYFEAWDPVVKKMWHDNCIDLLLNCSGGNLGNGKKLTGAQIPTYIINGVAVQSWTNPNRLVNIP
jgi:hypothetical protein